VADTIKLCIDEMRKKEPPATAAMAEDLIESLARAVVTALARRAGQVELIGPCMWLNDVLNGEDQD